MMVDWAILKNFVDIKKVAIHWHQDSNNYFLMAVDGYVSLQCILNKNNYNDDIIDFETNYKTIGNTSFSDIDGIPFVRFKASKKGWSFWALPIELTTSTIGGSVYCKDASEIDIPGITCKIYNSNNEEITTPGLLNANLNTAVKTVLDFEPAFDYEMIGGELRINNNQNSNMRLWIVGAPDIPAELGGSKEFASGVNLKFMAPDNSFNIDGRVTKYVTYSPITHQGKLRVILKHDAGASVNLQLVIHTYRL